MEEAIAQDTGVLSGIRANLLKPFIIAMDDKFDEINGRLHSLENRVQSMGREFRHDPLVFAARMSEGTRAAQLDDQHVEPPTARMRAQPTGFTIGDGALYASGSVDDATASLHARQSGRSAAPPKKRGGGRRKSKGNKSKRRKSKRRKTRRKKR